MRKIKIVFIVILLLIVGLYFFYKQGTMPFNQSDKITKNFIITPGESGKDIVNDLAKNDLIRSRVVFYLMIKFLGTDTPIQAGDFRLSPSMNAFEIAKTLTHGTLDAWVTLIEGTRKEEMAQVISENLGIPEVEFDKYGQEGYLFPDTYLFPKDATAGSVVNIMESNFNRKFTVQMKEKAKSLGLTPEQVVVLASLVEKEGRTPLDKPVVAGIFLKRLKADWPLQVDATIQYALGYQPEERTWWKKYLSITDLKFETPFNTYLNKGLPPSPICNPGLTSLESVVNADINTDYWYYLSDKNAKMHFAKTLQEHESNIQKYLR